nr:MAG TPA: hypothetical protein [Bacteriophage sp.]
MGNETGALVMLAQRLWNNFFRHKVKETQTDMLRFYRAEVTKAAANGKITVRRPFDTTEASLGYVASMAGAPVGSQVVVLVFGEKKNAANQKIIMYTDGSNL